MKIFQKKDVQELWCIDGQIPLTAIPYKQVCLRMLKWMIKELRDTENSFIIQKYMQKWERN